MGMLEDFVSECVDDCIDARVPMPVVDWSPYELVGISKPILHEARQTLFGQTIDELKEVAYAESDQPWPYLCGMLEANLNAASHLLGRLSERLDEVERKLTPTAEDE